MFWYSQDIFTNVSLLLFKLYTLVTGNKSVGQSIQIAYKVNNVYKVWKENLQDKYTEIDIESLSAKIRLNDIVWK